MSYEIGQDVIVECDSILDGEAFIASVDEEAETLFGDGVIVDVRDRDGIDAEIAQISTNNVVTLTKVFDANRKR